MVHETWVLEFWKTARLHYSMIQMAGKLNQSHHRVDSCAALVARRVSLLDWAQDWRCIFALVADAWRLASACCLPSGSCLALAVFCLLVRRFSGECFACIGDDGACGYHFSCWRHYREDLNLKGQIQMKTKKLFKWFGRRQHFDIALLLRRRLGVLESNIMGDRKARNHRRFLHQEFLRKQLMWDLYYDTRTKQG